jgi:hypothetical protein
MKVYDRGRILVGVIIFLALFSYPFWSAAGKPSEPPKVELPKDVKECVAPTSYMRSSHMQLLIDWRDAVVRDGNRVWTSHTGKKYNMSLTNECLRCHTDKAKFCDQCHNYASVNPFCWDCHTFPKPKESK